MNSTIKSYCCVFMLTLATQFIVSAQADGNLAAWYKMDEIVEFGGVRKIADASGNSRDLTLGSGCWLTNGLAGAALHFNGTADAWSTFSSPALGNRTVSLLFRREESNGPIYYGELYEYGNKVTFPYVIDSLSGMRVHLRTNTDNNRVFVGNGDLGWPGDFSRDQWNHLAWVYEEVATGEPNVFNSVCKFYVNGLLKGSLSKDDLTNKAVAGTAYLGNYSTKLRPIYGELDDVKIYSAALTAAEVKQEALRSMAAERTPRLIGHWTMEEIVTTNSIRLIRDLSGNGRDLELGDGCQLANGVDGKSLHFNGATNAFSLFSNWPSVTSYSFAGWIRQDRNSSPPVVSGNSFPRIFYTSAVNMYMHFYSYYNQVSCFGFGYTVNQSYVFPCKGIWAHYAMVNRAAYNVESNEFSSILEFYVNGQKMDEGRETIVGGLVWDPQETIFIGNYSVNGNRPFMGEFDDFRFYDGALSEAQVKAIYQSLPPVLAGADFTTASDRVILQGLVGNSNENPLRLGCNVQVIWTLVSAPEGGETAEIETPESAVTRATLPVVGDYVFRLTVYNSAETASDEVSVSRVTMPTENLPPTVTLDSTASVTLPMPLALNAVVADQDDVLGRLRVMWTKASGPGGVYFDSPFTNTTTATFLDPGSYVLRCTADDGAATAAADITVTVTGESSTGSLTNGLVRYYPMNSYPLNEEVVDGSTAMEVANYEAGIAGYGMRSYAANGYSDTKLTLPESGVVNEAVTNLTHLACSFWMYHDTADTNVCADAALLHASHTLGIYYRCQNTSPGFLLFQQGPGAKMTQYYFPGPTLSPEDRWTHVYTCFDREAGSELELYIDGVKQTKSSSSGASPARIRAITLLIGGMTMTSGGPQGPITNSVSGGYYSRVFPGVIDEVRLYNRKLSDAEINTLATCPVRVNREPMPELESKIIMGIKGSNKPLEAVVYDDGLPLGSSIESHWKVISGDAAGLSIDDETSLNTTVTLLELGAYTLQLEVSDGERISYSDVVTVVVNPGGAIIMLR